MIFFSNLKRRPKMPKNSQDIWEVGMYTMDNSWQSSRWISYFILFIALKLSLESDDEQLSWLKQFERSGVKTGESEEVLRQIERELDIFRWSFPATFINSKFRPLMIK